jgi:RNA-splicing ligase RtcB
MAATGAMVDGAGRKFWRSCSHGAGRRHSTQARKLFRAEDLKAQMAGKQGHLSADRQGASGAAR